jgi:predicted Zn-dependent protease
MAANFRLRTEQWTICVCGLFLIAGLCPPARGQFNLNKLKKYADKAQKVQEASKPMTLEDERELGRSVSAKMIAAFHIYRNDPLTRYVNEVGETVAAQSERQDIQYHFAVLDSNDVNAFSAPGGYVFITLGALRLCENESELAGVLGHEIGHIAAKHIVHEIEDANKKGAIASEVGSSVGDLTQNQPGSALYQKAIENLTRNILMTIFDKGLPAKDEYDADERGVRYAHAAGYPADGLERFLNAFTTATAPGGAQSYMTTTHPPVNDRNDRIQKQIAQQQWQDADRPQLADRYSTLTAMLKAKSGS